VLDFHLLSVCGYRVESLFVLLLFSYAGGSTHGSTPTFEIGLFFMSLMLWVFGCLLTAVHAEPLRYLLSVTRLTGEYCCEGHVGVKGKLVFERWLKSVDEYLNDGSNAPKRGRWASIKYETLRTGFDFSGEDFQNTGTFIVVRSSVFSVSSAQKTHLARDAYHAFWRGAGCCQDEKRHYENAYKPGVLVRV